MINEGNKKDRSRLRTIFLRKLLVTKLQARNFTNGEIESGDLMHPFFEIPCLSCLQVSRDKVDVGNILSGTERSMLP